MHDVNRKNFINTIGVRSFPFFRLQQQRRSVRLFGIPITKKPCRIHDRAFLCLDYALPAQPSTSTILWATIAFTAARAGFRY